MHTRKLLITMEKLCRQVCVLKLLYALNVGEAMFLAAKQQHRLSIMRKTPMEGILKVQMQQALLEAALILKMPDIYTYPG